MSRARQKDSASPGGRGRVRAERVEVRWLDGALGFATLTVDDATPTILMIDGDTFMRADLCGVFVDRCLPPFYLQVKPYRVDAGLLEVAS